MTAVGREGEPVDERWIWIRTSPSKIQLTLLPLFTVDYFPSGEGQNDFES
jgi:hypothetical protein